jgi:hypothetical protein
MASSEKIDNSARDDERTSRRHLEVENESRLLSAFHWRQYWRRNQEAPESTMQQIAH